jgi:endonuclease YncB( thermonuclease family)
MPSPILPRPSRNVGRCVLAAALLLLLLLTSSPSSSALDFKKALLSGIGGKRQQQDQDHDDPATVSKADSSQQRQKKRKRQTTADMGQCISDLLGTPQQQETQAAVQTVLGAAAQATATSELVHASLPKDAVTATVRNVYDGDTLTLTDERRVRLVGIDTPELKEKQPYAAEAKSYTKEKCDRQQVWLTFASTNVKDREDHYGRLLALVWVKAPGGYLCVNEGIVAAGYARVYRPTTSTKIPNWSKLLELQSTARQQKRGVWRDFRDVDVVKTTNGSAYHHQAVKCSHLSHSQRLITLKTSAAMEMGLHPCRTCLATGG